MNEKGSEFQASEFKIQQFLGAGGIKLSADIGGDPQAVAVVLLHGGGQTRHSWATAMRGLVRNGFYVINLDSRGHGDSDWDPKGDYSLDILAEDLQRVIATLDRPPVLIGASMGGATALLLAGSNTKAAASALILVDVVPRINLAGADAIRGFMDSGKAGFHSLEEAAAAVAAYNPHRRRPVDVSGLMKNLRVREGGRLFWHWDPSFLLNKEGTAPAAFEFKLNQAAERVVVPSLLIRGLKSNIVTDEGVAELRHHLPGLEVIDVGAAGHMVVGDSNDEFNQAVFDFLRRRLAVK